MRKVVGLFVALAFVSACGSHGNTITHDYAGGATVTMGDVGNGPAMVAKVTAPGQGVPPTDLPAWAPIYPGSKVLQVVDIAMNGEAGMPGGPHKQVVLTTDDPIAKVMAFYDQKLAAAGVKSMMRSDVPEGGMIAVKTPSGQPDTISVGKVESGTGIGITYAVKK